MKHDKVFGVVMIIIVKHKLLYDILVIYYSIHVE